MFQHQRGPVVSPPYITQTYPLAQRSINTPPPRSFQLSHPSLPPSCRMPDSPPLPHFAASHHIPQGSANPAPIDFFSSPLRAEPTTSPPDRRRDDRFTRRIVSANPFQRSSEQRRERQRGKFLEKIEDRRVEKRWDARGDQILQLDYVMQRKAWEAQQAEGAPSLDADEVLATFDDDYGDIRLQTSTPYNTESTDCATAKFPGSTDMFDPDHDPTPDLQTPASMQVNVLSTDAEELDGILEAENRDLEALIAMSGNELSGQQPWLEGIDPRSSSPMYCSDDEEFEELMLGLSDGTEGMDLSSG